jgi:hypothetical protein
MSSNLLCGGGRRYDYLCHRHGGVLRSERSDVRAGGGGEVASHARLIGQAVITRRRSGCLENARAFDDDIAFDRPTLGPDLNLTSTFDMT